MSEISIYGANRFESYSKTRAGCRAIIVREGKILLSHEVKSGWWLIPGGGWEEGETPEACCVREAEEETGYLVRPERHFLRLYEYYEEYRYISDYFICSVIGKGEMHLTPQERERGLVPEWMAFTEALKMYSHHEEYADISEEKRGSYEREYRALLAYQEYLHR